MSALLQITTIRLSHTLGTVVMDEPPEGQTMNRYALQIAGRLEAPDLDASRIAVRVNGQPLPDWVLFTAGERRPFFVIISLFDLPERFRIVLSAYGEHCRATEFARLEGSRARYCAATQPPIQPLLLTTLGRTGSTYAMRLLGGHPSILYDRKYPHETRIAQYYAHLVAVQARPPRQTEPDFEQFNDPRRLGPNPHFLPDERVFDWFADDAVRLAMDYGLAATEGFYRRLAAAEGWAGPFAWYLEKAPPSIERLRLLQALYPGARAIVLCRDPRDMLASVLAFNAKRGYAAFGRERAGDDSDYARQLAQHCQQLVHFLEANPSAYLLRYEDLISTPRETLSPLLAALALEADTAVIDAMLSHAQADTPQMVYHRTSAEPQASVGRWRQDLSAELQGVCAEAMAPCLRALGYAP